jgi:hypothetical protein
MAENIQKIALRLLGSEVPIVLTPLYVRDDVLAELVFGPQAVRLWRPELIRRLEREGLPPQRQLFGTMRYLPAVCQFFAKREGLRSPALSSEPDDGPENFGAP